MKARVQSNPSKHPIGKWVLVSSLILLIAFFFYMDLGRFFTLESIQSNRQALENYTQHHFAWTALLYVSIYTIQTALSLPGATILTLVGGFLFGAWLGTIFVNLGATSGAALAFLAARYLFRETVERNFGTRLHTILEGFSRNAFNYLLTLRLIPLFPFFLVNLASGLTRVQLPTYILATAIGILPGSFVYANAGSQLGSIESIGDIASPRVVGAFVLLGVLALVPVVYKKLKKPKMDPE